MKMAKLLPLKVYPYALMCISMPTAFLKKENNFQLPVYLFGQQSLSYMESTLKGKNLILKAVTVINLGPVVQSIVSLTSSLRGQLLSVLC